MQLVNCVQICHDFWMISLGVFCMHTLFPHKTEALAIIFNNYECLNIVNKILVITLTTFVLGSQKGMLFIYWL